MLIMVTIPSPLSTEPVRLSESARGGMTGVVRSEAAPMVDPCLEEGRCEDTLPGTSGCPVIDPVDNFLACLPSIVGLCASNNIPGKSSAHLPSSLAPTLGLISAGQSDGSGRMQKTLSAR
jgi:hypothetical protein